VARAGAGRRVSPPVGSAALARSSGAGLPIHHEVSAGGVAYRRSGTATEVALVRVGERRRWQLPKGLVDPGERPEQAAVREVREEAGIEAELVEPLDTIEYWYVDRWSAERARVHKRVHFFLLRYLRGDVADHDQEVLEAKWLEIGEAIAALSFESERRVTARARERIEAHAP
jgi:8-oxo-dGTP pyrophosphatase MutT (NUDIX family)